jgi:hypothetical protein
LEISFSSGLVYSSLALSEVGSIGNTIDKGGCLREMSVGEVRSKLFSASSVFLHKLNHPKSNLHFHRSTSDALHNQPPDSDIAPFCSAEGNL